MFVFGQPEITKKIWTNSAISFLRYTVSSFSVYSRWKVERNEEEKVKKTITIWAPGRGIR